MDIEKLIERLKKASADGSWNTLADYAHKAATALSTLQAENEKLRDEVESLKKGHCTGCSVPVVKTEQLKDLNDAPKLRAELEQVALENNALWTYIEIVDREYRRYMDRGYVDRLDELKRTWKCGQKED